MSTETKGLSVSELMKVRYKVIALWPNTEFKVGEIICPEANVYRYGIAMGHKFYDQFPHLFKKLEWWEERKESDMPEYVKRIAMDEKQSYIGVRVGGIDKVKIAMTDKGIYLIIATDGEGDTIIMYDLHRFVPATKEEYENNQKHG